MESISKEKIFEIMKHSPSNIGTMRFIFEGIEMAPREKRGELLDALFTGQKFLQSDESIILCEDNTIDKLNLEKVNLIEEKLFELREENPEEKEFADKLVDFIWNIDLFKDSKERFQVVMNISHSNLIPYYQLEDTDKFMLNSTEVRKIIRDIVPEKLAHFNFILNSIFDSYPIRFLYKTQSAHLLLMELENLDSEEEKAVMFVKILDFYEQMIINRIINIYGGNEND